MKTASFFTSVIIMILSGLWMFQNRNSDESLFDFEFLKPEKLSPIEEWPNLLLGDWDFYQKMNTDGKYWNTYEGELSFYADGTFKIYETIRRYFGKPYESGSDNFIIAGGQVQGTYKFNEAESYFNQVVESCHFEVSKNTSTTVTDSLDYCRSLFPKNNELKFGKISEKDWKSSVIEFNENRIEFLYNYYSSGTKSTMILERQ